MAAKNPRWPPRIPFFDIFASSFLESDKTQITKKKKNKGIAMMRRKSTPSENIYLKKKLNNYQTNISKLGHGKGFIPFFKNINEIQMYFVYMAL